MGFDPQKSLTQMHKDSYTSYRIWVEMMELATKKIGGGEGQSPFDKMQKKYDFIRIFLRIRLMKRRASLNNILAFKKTLGNNIQENVPGTLTVIPVAAC
jgi:hypothetical protein